MANVWFLGDLHAGHKNVHKFRKQFESEEHHFETMKENYHKKVTKRDKVYFMGDTAFTLDRLKDVSTWTADRKVLICGNHDTDHVPMKVLCEYFDEVYSLVRYKNFWLSHCPVHPEELRGKLNIHGHVHNQTLKDWRYFNTSLENTDFYPIDLNGVKDRIQTYKDELEYLENW